MRDINKERVESRGKVFVSDNPGGDRSTGGMVGSGMDRNEGKAHREVVAESLLEFPGNDLASWFEGGVVGFR